jgi:hypothetical protein
MASERIEPPVVDSQRLVQGLGRLVELTRFLPCRLDGRPVKLVRGGFDLSEAR